MSVFYGWSAIEAANSLIYRRRLCRYIGDSLETNKKFLENAILEKIRSLLKQILAYNYRHDLVLFDLNNVVLNIPNDRKIPAVHAKDILREKYPEFNKHVTTHTFRYTHISLLEEAKVPIKAIMDRVGHANMKTRLEICNQVSSAAKEIVIQEVDSWIF